MSLPISITGQPYICTGLATLPVGLACLSNGIPVNLAGNISDHLTVNATLPSLACLDEGLPTLPEASIPSTACILPFPHPQTAFLPNVLNIACRGD